VLRRIKVDNGGEVFRIEAEVEMTEEGTVTQHICSWLKVWIGYICLIVSDVRD